MTHIITDYLLSRAREAEARAKVLEAEVADLKARLVAAYDRIGGQSELLSKKAEHPAVDVVPAQATLHGRMLDHVCGKHEETP